MVTTYVCLQTKFDRLDTLYSNDNGIQRNSVNSAAERNDLR